MADLEKRFAEVLSKQYEASGANGPHYSYHGDEVARLRLHLESFADQSLARFHDSFAGRQVDAANKACAALEARLMSELQSLSSRCAQYEAKLLSEVGSAVARYFSCEDSATKALINENSHAVQEAKLKIKEVASRCAAIEADTAARHKDYTGYVSLQQHVHQSVANRWAEIVAEAGLNGINGKIIHLEATMHAIENRVVQREEFSHMLESRIVKVEASLHEADGRLINLEVGPGDLVSRTTKLEDMTMWLARESDGQAAMLFDLRHDVNSLLQSMMNKGGPADVIHAPVASPISESPKWRNGRKVMRVGGGFHYVTTEPPWAFRGRHEDKHVDGTDGTTLAIPTSPPRPTSAAVRPSRPAVGPGYSAVRGY